MNKHVYKTTPNTKDFKELATWILKLPYLYLYY